MLSFRSMADIEAQRPRLPPRIARCVTGVMEGLLKAYDDYDPEDDGYIVAVTPETTNADADLPPELWTVRKAATTEHGGLSWYQGENVLPASSKLKRSS